MPGWVLVCVFLCSCAFGLVLLAVWQALTEVLLTMKYERPTAPEAQPPGLSYLASFSEQPNREDLSAEGFFF